jgi:hypothetical protein
MGAQVQASAPPSRNIATGWLIRVHDRPTSVIEQQLPRRVGCGSDERAALSVAERRLVASPMISRLRTTANCVFLSLRNAATTFASELANVVDRFFDVDEINAIVTHSGAPREEFARACAD